MSLSLPIESHHDWTPSDADWTDWQLYEHNVAATGRADWKAIGYVVRNEMGRTTGVAYGYSWAGASELKQLWVDENFRGRGYARRLLQAFIDEAQRRCVKRIWVASHDFQAPKLYEKFGFRTIAELEGWPDGHNNVLLCREFGDS